MGAAERREARRPLRPDARGPSSSGQPVSDGGHPVGRPVDRVVTVQSLSYGCTDCTEPEAPHDFARLCARQGRRTAHRRRRGRHGDPDQPGQAQRPISRSVAGVGRGRVGRCRAPCGSWCCAARASPSPRVSTGRRSRPRASTASRPSSISRAAPTPSSTRSSPSTRRRSPGGGATTSSPSPPCRAMRSGRASSSPSPATCGSSREDVQFAMRETSLGLVPDLTGTHPLVALVGYARALEICATGPLRARRGGRAHRPRQPRRARRRARRRGPGPGRRPARRAPRTR